MNARDFQKFVKFLIENYQVWSPQEEGGEGLIKELSEPEKAAFSSRLAFYSWKKFFIPECENIFEYHGNFLSPVWQMPAGKKGLALLGLNILDLKSVLLYDRVFSAKGGSASGREKDPYYQNRRLTTLVIAHSLLPNEEHNMARIAYNQINLKHYKFDIFFETFVYCHPG